MSLALGGAREVRNHLAASTAGDGKSVDVFIGRKPMGKVPSHYGHSEKDKTLKGQDEGKHVV